MRRLNSGQDAGGTDTGGCATSGANDDPCLNILARVTYEHLFIRSEEVATWPIPRSWSP